MLVMLALRALLALLAMLAMLALLALLATLAMLHPLHCRVRPQLTPHLGRASAAEGRTHKKFPRAVPARTGSGPHASHVSRVAIVLLLAKISAVLRPKKPFR
ncbi:hypothetical protein AV530_000173 [Patagioenas fasciata monilis]|uniref:Uncharacterized protein n=1 Tax=Patagioenas fasciata monilis TaxID=372326 RepID=A0A1V4KAW6_PATFA|nr:hypothetical protein AV530_000173 [Patagioenas fasciata monilis]